MPLDLDLVQILSLFRLSLAVPREGAAALGEVGGDRYVPNFPPSFHFLRLGTPTSDPLPVFFFVFSTRAVGLTFPHPITGEEMSFSLPEPEKFE